MPRHPAGPDPRLEQFRALDPSTSWDQRLKLVKRLFPHQKGDAAQWKKAFDLDIDLMGRILRDVLKADHAVPGRPGPRPALDRAQAEPQVDVWLGRDPVDHPYTSLPFKDALRLLAGRHSLTQIARKIELSRTQTHRLLKGEIVPDAAILQRVADVYGKQISYFVEYRIGVVANSMVSTMQSDPDSSVRFYEALFR